MNTKSIVAILALLSVSVMNGQILTEKSESRPSYGIFSDFNLNRHTADFRAFPGVPNCCPKFESGSGGGFSIGGFYEFLLSEKFSLSIRAGYSGYNADLTTVESTSLIQGDGLTAGSFEHSINAKISALGVEPLLVYGIANNISLLGGVRLDMLSQKSFSQKEVVLSPSSAAFDAEGHRIRNEFSGDIPDVSAIQGALLLGARYRLPMNASGSMFLQPEALYSLGLTNVVSGLSWKIGAIRLGLSLAYSPQPAPEIIPVPEPERKPGPKPVVVKPTLSASVSAFSVAEDNREISVETAPVKREEFISTSMRPLLNFVFFDENSAELPSRYKRIPADETGTFSLDKLTDEETLPMYYNILNIIGQRLKENPSAGISIVGCNADVESEQGNKELSRKRAETVRDYLQNVWGISPKRMAISARNLPEKPSGNTDADGIAENRRVEIIADSWKVSEPVIASDTISTTSARALRFRISAQAQAGVESWSLVLKQGGKILKEFSGKSTPPTELEWAIDKKSAVFTQSSTPIEYALVLNDGAGQKIAPPAGNIMLEQITIEKKRREQVGDKSIDRYSLILFDFGKSDLTAVNERLADFVRGKISPTSRVEIIGYTDRIGDAELNRKISESRAKAVAQKLGVNATAKGAGESVQIFDNALPEGRFYSRTVEILVETPIK